MHRPFDGSPQMEWQYVGRAAGRGAIFLAGWIVIGGALGWLTWEGIILAVLAGFVALVFVFFVARHFANRNANPSL